MKLILLCLINIIFTDSLSEWIDLNRHIIDSKSYKVSFDQKLETVIGGSSHHILDMNTNIIFFKNQIRYESSDRIIIANKDSLKLLNKKNNQLFIDDVDNQYNFLFEFDLIKILENNEFVNFKDSSYYYIIQNDLIDSKIYFKNQVISMIKIFANNIDVELSNVNLLALDTLNINNYFNINDTSIAIFDLRAK